MQTRVGGPDSEAMVVQWVFSRGDERTLIDIVRTELYYVVHVREPRGERWMTVATALEAILRQADVERALTWGGWSLADFLRSGRQPCAPTGPIVALAECAEGTALAASVMSRAVDAPAPPPP